MQNDSSEKITVLGDIHNGKATVLVEKDGVCFIRKPGSAATELAFKAFLSRLREEGFLYLPGTVEILRAEENLHEVSIVPHLPLQSIEEANLYYKRCGALLFFSYLFSSNDLHFENIRACGAFPTIVDYETILTGQIDRTEKPYKTLAESVFASHLLPHWSYVDGEDIDKGGFTSNGENAPIFNGNSVPAYKYADKIAEGFEYAYQFALEHRPLFSELIKLFENCKFRTLIRPTQLYIQIANFLATKENTQRELIARSLLERVYKKDKDPNRIHQVAKTLTAEIDAVLNGEAPLFWVYGNGHDLQNREEIVHEGFFSKSPVEKAQDVLKNLTPADMETQLRILSQSLCTVRPIKESCSALPKCDNALDSVYNHLENSYLDGFPSGWLHLDRSKDMSLYLSSCGFGLYNGLLGILCFYAALYYKTKDEKVLDALMRHYKPYREYGIPKSVLLSDRTASLSDGIGGHLCALCHIAKLTDKEIFYEDALRLLDAIRIPNSLNDECDILGGLGGLAIALPHFQKQKTTDIANALAPIISSFEPTLGGMAHGAAGIALALGALGKVLDTDEFDRRILSLIRIENRAFDNNAKNWYDLRYSDKRGFMTGWCSGAPGIGIARHKLKEYTCNEEIKALCEKDIDYVREMLSGYNEAKRDCLCCGASSILMAASVLNVNVDNEYLKLSKHIKESSLHLNHIADTCDNECGLMQGIAGVGYALAMYKDELCGGMLF